MLDVADGLRLDLYLYYVPAADVVSVQQDVDSALGFVFSRDGLIVR